MRIIGGFTRKRKTTRENGWSLFWCRVLRESVLKSVKKALILYIFSQATQKGIEKVHLHDEVLDSIWF